MGSDYFGIVNTNANQSIDELIPVAYEELKRMARHYLRAHEDSATLCTTELVHEAFFKLAGGAGAEWQGRSHFFGAAARAMREVLVDFARRRRAEKRGGGVSPITLRDDDVALEMQLDEILAVDEALNALDKLDPRLRQIVELRFFAALSETEIAELLNVSVRTVERDWLKARMLLVGALKTPQ